MGRPSVATLHRVPEKEPLRERLRAVGCPFRSWPPAAVVKLLLDDARRAHMEKRSRVVAEQRFDATVWVSSLLDFYLEVV